jgi:hypothetical protein
MRNVAPADTECGSRPPGNAAALAAPPPESAEQLGQAQQFEVARRLELGPENAQRECLVVVTRGAGASSALSCGQIEPL